MKKMIFILSVVLIGFMLVFSGPSVAASKKGRPYAKWDHPGAHHHVWKRAPHPASHLYRGGHRHHRWAHSHGHPRWFRGRAHHTVIRQINNHYNSDEGYPEPQDSFNVEASVSDTGFSFSFGVSAAD